MSAEPRIDTLTPEEFDLVRAHRIDRALDEVKVPVLATADLALKLGKVKRITRHPDGQRESVTTHTVMLALIAYQLARHEKLDKLDMEAVLVFALVHDLVEAIAGDTPTLHALTDEERAEKDAREQDALKTILDRAPVLAHHIDAYEKQATREARYVRALDKAMPRILAALNGGSTIREHGMDLEDVRERMRTQGEDLAAASPDLPFTNAFLKRAASMVEEHWGRVAASTEPPELDAEGVAELHALLDGANVARAGEGPEALAERVRWLIGLWQEADGGENMKDLTGEMDRLMAENARLRRERDAYAEADAKLFSALRRVMPESREMLAADGRLQWLAGWVTEAHDEFKRLHTILDAVEVGEGLPLDSRVRVLANRYEVLEAEREDTQQRLTETRKFLDEATSLCRTVHDILTEAGASTTRRLDDRVRWLAERVRQVQRDRDREEENCLRIHGLLADVCDAAFGDETRAETHAYDGVLERVKELAKPPSLVIKVRHPFGTHRFKLEPGGGARFNVGLNGVSIDVVDEVPRG